MNSCSSKLLNGLSQFKSCIVNGRISNKWFSVKRHTDKPKEWQLKSLTENTRLVPEINKAFGSHELLLNGLVIERLNDNLLVKQTHDENIVDSDRNLNTSVHILCSQRASLSNSHIVPGDRVQFVLTQTESSKGCVVNLKDRVNVLQRPSVGSNVHKLKLNPIASNIDQLMIVVAVVPKVPNLILDRYLVAAHSYNIPHVHIVINKFDLEGSDEVAMGLRHYTRLGYKLIRTSTKTEDGMDALKKVLANKTSIFVGQSGVGKSSLINSILPEVHIKTAELVSKKEVGAHTTSNARWYDLPTTSGGGSIIDSPGIRELGTWHLDRMSIARGFPEIFKYSKYCKYRNCSHTEAESGQCGVHDAVKRGRVHKERLRSFHSMNQS